MTRAVVAFVARQATGGRRDGTTVVRDMETVTDSQCADYAESVAKRKSDEGQSGGGLGKGGEGGTSTCKDVIGGRRRRHRRRRRGPRGKGHARKLP